MPVRYRQFIEDLLVAALCLLIPSLLFPPLVGHGLLSSSIPINSTVRSLSNYTTINMLEPMLPLTAHNRTMFHVRLPPISIARGHRNPISMSILARDIQKFVLSSNDLDVAIMKSDIEDKHSVSRCLRLIEVFGQQCDPALKEYMNRAITSIDRILLSALFTSLLPQATHSGWTSVRFKFWTDDVDLYSCEREQLLHDDFLNELKMVIMLHHGLGTQHHVVYEVLDGLDGVLGDLETFVTKDRGRDAIADDWKFTSFGFGDTHADDALLKRLISIVQQLTRSISDVRDHLNFLQDAINDLKENHLDILCMGGRLSIKLDLTSLGDGYLRIRNELSSQ